MPSIARCGSTAASVKALITMAMLLGCGHSYAKSPGGVHCYGGVCHRVKTLDETVDAIGRVETAVASFYDDASRDRFTPGRETSSGEIFDADSALSVASPVWPDGTKLMVWSELTGRAALVRVNDAGPYFGNRKLDLSRALAEELGIAKLGVATVKLVVIGAPTSEEARYSKGRSYPPMTGVMGQFASMDAALGRINEGTADPSVRVAALEAPVVSKLTVAALSPAITPVAKLKKPTLQVAEIRDDERQLKVPRAKPSPPKAGETEDWQTALLNQHR